MKRHPALEPFSRDHNDGLILARSLQLGRDGACEQAKAAWEAELRDHFEEEERLLGSLAKSEMFARLVEDHAQIADLVTRLPDSTVLLGNALHDHIRWEERVLFPDLEASASEEDLGALARETDRLEERRWAGDARRKELVQRRRR